MGCDGLERIFKDVIVHPAVNHRIAAQRNSQQAKLAIVGFFRSCFVEGCPINLDDR